MSFQDMSNNTDPVQKCFCPFDELCIRVFVCLVIVFDVSTWFMVVTHYVLTYMVTPPTPHTPT